MENLSPEMGEYFYFWSKELQRESAREGQVEEGVRVALLKLVTDGSRPMGEMSDSWRERQNLNIYLAVLNANLTFCLVLQNCLDKTRTRGRKTI